MEGCIGDEPRPDNFKLVNMSGQKITIVLHDVFQVFPDSLILLTDESYEWTSDVSGEPFKTRKSTFHIYFNDNIVIPGFDFPKDRNIYYYQSYLLLDYVYTFTFTEADYLYALEHGTPVGPA